MAATADFDSPAFLEATVKLVQGLSEVLQVYQGAPNTVGPRVAAYVTLAHQEPEQRAVNGPRGGYFSRWAWALIVFCYRITDLGPVAEAEAQLASYLDNLWLAVYSDRTMGGVVQDVQLDLLMSRVPEYQTRSGQEFREYPVMLAGKQTHTMGA